MYEVSIHGGWTIDKLMLLSLVSHLTKSTTKGGKKPTADQPETCDGGLAIRRTVTCSAWPEVA